MICLELIVEVSCAVLVVVPLLFVWNEVYEDGFFGRIALAAISFSALVTGVKEYEVPGLYVRPETVLLLSSAAVFLCWHLIRFHRRVLIPKKQGLIERRRFVA